MEFVYIETGHIYLCITLNKAFLNGYAINSVSAANANKYPGHNSRTGHKYRIIFNANKCLLKGRHHRYMFVWNNEGTVGY